jgi:hypothetical protein
VVAAIAFLSRLTGGREFTDDLPGIHFLASHPLALVGHNRALLDKLAGGFAAYPPLQPLLMALALAPFTFLPDFWSHRLATALVVLACTYQGWGLLSARSQPGTATRRLIGAAVFVQLICASAVWAQLDDAIAALVVLSIARLRPKTATGAILASGAMLFCSKSLLFPAAAALIVIQFRSAKSWKRVSTVIALAAFVIVLVLNRLTMRLLPADPFTTWGDLVPTLGVGLTTLLWNLGLHAKFMRNAVLQFPMAICVGVLLATWKVARTSERQGGLFQMVVEIAPVAGRFALVLSELFIGFSQPEYLLWIVAGWLLLSPSTLDSRLFRQLTMLSLAAVAAWGTNICYGLVHAEVGPKRRLLDIVASYTGESGLHALWYLCLFATSTLLIGTIAADFGPDQKQLDRWDCGRVGLIV